MVSGVRILHTSDWHLGRLFHRSSLLDVQAEALDRIVQIVVEESVDLVLIAGDLYDRSVPPADAVELFGATLVRLREAGATVVAISGNHDSSVRVGYADPLLARVGVTVRGDVARSAHPVEVPSTDGGPPVVVYPIPYLDPLTTAHVARSDRGRDRVSDALPAPVVDGADSDRGRFTHHDAMVWATDRVRSDLSERAAQGAPVRSVLVAHTFITGGNPSESERELTVGQVDQVRMDAFDGFDYVALGHLHQGQAFDGGRVAYSGTPLPYSFSEQHHTKAVRLVDLAPDGSLSVRVVPLGVGRSLRTISGELEHLLADPSLTDAEGAWVSATLTDRQLPLQAMARLQQRFPYAVELRHEPATPVDASTVRRTSSQVRSAQPLDLTLAFLEEQRGLPADDAERQLVADAIGAARRQLQTARVDR